MLEKIKEFDYIDICLFFICLGICISLIIFVSNFSSDYTEESCVNFYKKTHYITEKCEKYRKKLEALDLNEK